MDRRRVVLLDMDGVIIDGMRFHVRAWQETFKQFFEVDVTQHEILLAEGVKAEEIIEQVASRVGVELTATEILSILRFKQDYHRGIFRVEPIQGASELVHTLQELDYPLALVTGSGRETTMGALAVLGMARDFSSVVTGDDVTSGKPSPEPYLTAARELGASPDYCLVIENAPAGIAAAKAGKMVCWAVETSLSAQYLDGADRVLGSHAELESLLREEHAVSNGTGPWSA
jgi:beta-phosphoglucomutase